MPVDTARCAVRQVAATYIEKKTHGKGCVLLIRKVMLITAHDIADISLRPVTLFADGLRRPRIVRRDMNRSIEVITGCVIELFDPVHLSLEIGCGSRTYMAGNTFHF